MAYGPEYKTGHASYTVVLLHPETGVQALVQVSPAVGTTGAPTDLPAQMAVRDAVFQEILSEIAALGSLTVISATKLGGYAADVTP